MQAERTKAKKPPVWTSWNLWHGCHKVSAGCAHCYVYRGDAKRGRDSAVVEKTLAFDLPVRRKRDGEYRVPSGSLVATCFTSDFFVEDADPWRAEAWAMMRERSDLRFFMITKRPERIAATLPPDWGAGYPNVAIGCTVENQQMADLRLPVFLALPILRKMIICEPLLSPIDLSAYLPDPYTVQVVAGGESGAGARPCDYAWVLSLRDICLAAGISFWFKQTGANFIKEGRTYRISRWQQHSQARKAAINIGVKMW